MTRPLEKKRLPPLTEYPAGTPKPAARRNDLDSPTEEASRPTWMIRILTLLRAGKSTMSKPIGTPREQKRVSGDLGSLGSFDSMDFGPPANPDALRGTRESNAWVVEDISHPARKPDRFRRGVYIEDHDGG